MIPVQIIRTRFNINRTKYVEFFHCILKKFLKHYPLTLVASKSSRFVYIFLKDYVSDHDSKVKSAKTNFPIKVPFAMINVNLEVIFRNFENWSFHYC